MNGGVILAQEKVDLKAESGLRREKSELSLQVFQYASGLSPLLTKSQADLFKISFSCA